MQNVTVPLDPPSSSFTDKAYALGKNCLSSGKIGCKIGFCIGTSLALSCWYSTWAERNTHPKEAQITLTFTGLFISSTSLTGGLIGCMAPLAKPLLVKIGKVSWHYFVKQSKNRGLAE